MRWTEQIVKEVVQLQWEFLDRVKVQDQRRLNVLRISSTGRITM